MYKLWIQSTEKCKSWLHEIYIKQKSCPYAKFKLLFCQNKFYLQSMVTCVSSLCLQPALETINYKLWEELITLPLYTKEWKTNRRQEQILMPPDCCHKPKKRAATDSTSLLCFCQVLSTFNKFLQILTMHLIMHTSCPQYPYNNYDYSDHSEHLPYMYYALIATFPILWIQCPVHHFFIHSASFLE